jgi:hypothetical protein
MADRIFLNKFNTLILAQNTGCLNFVMEQPIGQSVNNYVEAYHAKKSCIISKSPQQIGKQSSTYEHRERN